MKHFMYVGTYTHKQQKAGIFVYRFDSETGTLEIVQDVEAGENPSFIAIHPDGTKLYSVLETSGYEGDRSGGVAAFTLDPETGILAPLNRLPSHGTSPCHLCVDPTGRCLIAVNYGSGSAVLFALARDGSLIRETCFIQHSGSSTHPERQTGPHAHSTTLSRDGRFAFIADLGIDRMMIYELDAGNGKLTPAARPFAELEPGSGPRHAAIHPELPVMYVINEIASTITVFDYDEPAGNLTPRETVSTLPGDFTASNSCADIHISPDGRFLYGSNRGHDSLAVYRIDPTDGALAPMGHTPTGGKTPRNFAISPGGRFLIAANQDSDSLVVFGRNSDSGRLEPTGTRAEVPMPVCVRFSG